MRQTQQNTLFPLVPQKVIVPKSDNKTVDRLKPYLVLHPAKNRLFQFRESQRWCQGLNTVVSVRAMPFVTREGYISSNAVYYWKCSATQWIASVSATVYQRLYDRWKRMRIDGDSIVPNRDLLLRVAVLYTLTLDDRLLVRTIECAKRNEGAARKLLYYRSREVDAITRFWYGQLTSVTSWLQLRSQRPRAKSTNLLSDYRIIEVNLDNSINRKAQVWLSQYTDFWVRDGDPIIKSENRLLTIR
jgi:hypothetical protein